MKTIGRLFKKIKAKYDEGLNPLDDLQEITVHCLDKLSKKTKPVYQGAVGTKKYDAFQLGKEFSRPFHPELFISSKGVFSIAWEELIGNIDSEKHKIKLSPEKIDRVLYTSLMAFAICFDLWRRTSRKTPGTYFEVLLGSIIGETLPDDYKRTKHIPLPTVDIEGEGTTTEKEEESVSTDIVFEKNKGGKLMGLVIPAKITTRERIVQPFAHQRILDGVFGPKRFHSILACVSEMQLDKKHKKVNEICVPGTIKLFQAHLAELTGIYYLDPPLRYLNKDLKNVIKIASIGELLAKDLPNLV